MSHSQWPSGYTGPDQGSQEQTTYFGSNPAQVQYGQVQAAQVTAPAGPGGPTQPGEAAGLAEAQTVVTQLDWSYGLPPGVRPELLSSPLGQHGAMAGSAWRDSAQKATSFMRLVLVEVQKLLGTVSSRLLLALAPIALVAAAYYGAYGDLGGARPTGAAYQNFGMLLALHLGQIPVYAVVVMTFTGEWHYRSVQLTLLLQPRRLRYGIAQIVPVVLLWLIMSLAQGALYLFFKTQNLEALPYQNFIVHRPWWILGIALLAGFVNMLFALCVAMLLKNPTAALVTYFLLMVVALFRFVNNEYAKYIDPWQPASLLAGHTMEILPSVMGSALLIAAVIAGFVVLARRDAH